MNDQGYVNYFEILGLAEDCKPGEVRKQYKKKMKDLVLEIARVEITPERRDAYLLELAKLNAAFYILRDNQRREQYVADRKRVIELEQEWRAAADAGETDLERGRRTFDGALRHFLSTYMEEYMLEAGGDKECVEASNWDPHHERHAGRVLRHFRQQLHRQILERLPYYEVTAPKIDWDERKRLAATLLAGERS